MSQDLTRPEGWPWKPDKVWGLRSHPSMAWRLTEPDLFDLWSRLYSGEDGDPSTLDEVGHVLTGRRIIAGRYLLKTHRAIVLLREASFMSSRRLGEKIAYTARKPTDDYWSRA